MKRLFSITLMTICLLNLSCKKFLDVIPDNVATLDHAFSDKTTTERYLITCYAGLPIVASPSANPAFLGGEEFWTWNILTYPEATDLIAPFRIARGEQNANNPFLNYYEGRSFQTIRKCNTFLEKVDQVPDIDEKTKAQWKAEVKVIKAYTMLYLIKMYGPIPIIKENLPISASPEEVRYKRAPFDECIAYIVSLIDESSESLLPKVINRQEDLGKITKLAALTIKSDALILAASPQFNGNPYYQNWGNKDGQKLFSAANPEKWKVAADACKAAIDYAELAGNKLYEYSNTVENLSDDERFEYTVRGTVTDELWNSEMIWTDINASTTGIQSNAMPYLDGRITGGGHMHLVLAVNMKVANEFYSANGVPIDEDKTWQGKSLNTLRTAVPAENGKIKGQTAMVNFDREGRFYGSVGFDRGVWYGNGKGNDQSGLNPWILLGLKGQAANKNGTGERSNITGYFAKKLINVQTSMRAPSTFTAKRYPFPVYRLADLFLMYAEALNEFEGPSATVYEFVDKVRTRAKLKGVVESWGTYSSKPTKFNSKDGMREIIQRERMIELSFEGKRFWDLRRWLLAEKFENQSVTGWNVNGESSEAYYNIQNIFNPSFTPRDYLWPIRQYILTVNTNLVQAPGW